MLRFGTSGIPLSSPRPATDAGIRRARELGLDCLEMAWGNGVRMGEAMAERIRTAARENDVELTAHAPYYVNLCGARDVRARSLKRLIDTGRLARRCGARSFCFHAGFYQRRDPEAARAGVRTALTTVAARLRDEGVRVDVRPELTGKPTQLGSLEEIVEWSHQVPGVHPCVDFSHHVARTQGSDNRYEGFARILEGIGARLGPRALRRLHVHVSGIEYGPRGERRHVPLRQSEFRYRELLRALKDHRVGGWVVCESPAMENDALVLERAYRRLR